MEALVWSGRLGYVMAMSALESLIEDPRAGIEAIAEYLDRGPPLARLEAVMALSRKAQRALYNKAQAAPALSLSHFVPDERAPLAPVVHHGRNTLPLPKKHRFFQKVFTRPDEEGAARLYGYNESPSRKLIGPGYFVAVPTDGQPAWQARGAVVIDYFQVPTGAVSVGWPRVVPNSAGLQRLVYYHTRDFMRAVSKHVSIGLACKEEKPLDHYFVLCRED